jgi:hypothetical protein
VTVLDDAVKAARPASGDVVGQGRPLKLPELEPWPESVDGAALLDDIAANIRAHVVMDKEAVNTLALWCVATHVFEQFEIFPRLTVRSPTPRCGKTTLRDVAAELVGKPLLADNISAPALFRTVEAVRPTLLLDEAETYLSQKDDSMRGIINSGHKRGGFVLRCVGEDHEPRQFSTFAPMLLALIGKPPATIYDRSIVLNLQRKKPSVRVERFRSHSRKELHKLARKALRWTRDNKKKILEKSDPAPLDNLNDRANDNWRPLLAVADVAGGQWPKLARDAAAKLADTTGHDAASTGEMLIHDIRSIFDGMPTLCEGKPVTESSPIDRVASTALVEHLAKIEGRPWAEWKQGKPITQNALAALLRKFGIMSGTIRLDGNQTLKGYKREDFRDVFSAYGGDQTVTTSQPNNGGHCDVSQSVTSFDDVTLRKASQPNNGGHCDVVTVGEGDEADEWTF